MLQKLVILTTQWLPYNYMCKLSTYSWSESLEKLITNETAGDAYDLIFLKNKVICIWHQLLFLKKQFLQNQEQTLLLLK